jgi:protein O-mannosyl-transferase
MMNLRFFLILLLTVSGLIVYSNSYDHGFNLDSIYGLLNNPYVRDLEFIPRYFVDPLTLTSYRSNGDYRPILQISYALNYWLSGYQMWSWHLVQIFLHVSVAAFLFLFLSELRLGSDKNGPKVSLVSAYVTAQLFLLHPYCSGVVNYLWARSSLLVAAFLLPSFFLYRRLVSGGKIKEYWVWILYALALWTKVEAIAALAAYFVIFVLTSRPRAGPLVNEGPRRAFLGGGLRLLPFIAITIIYLIVRHVLVPDFTADMRHGDQINRYNYFLTQLTVWWHYALRWFAPFNLIADDTSYVVVNSLGNPRVILAISGLGCLAFFVADFWRKQAYDRILLVSLYFILLSPHSSISPLGEMVNEHRPYLPLALLSALWVVPFMSSGGGGGKRLRWVVIVLAATAFSLLTYQRNEVFATGETYWHDVLQKAPSARSHMNYGLSQMRQGKVKTAVKHFETTLEEAPNWFFAHINMGLALSKTGEDQQAKQHFDRAVSLEKHSSIALYYRGLYHRRLGQQLFAFNDFVAALDKAIDKCPLLRELRDMPRFLADTDFAATYHKMCR